MKKLLLAIFVFSAVYLEAQNIPNGVPTDSLKAYFTLNDSNDDDVTGNYGSLSLNGNPTKIFRNSCENDSCYEFGGTSTNGSGNRLNLPSNFNSAFNNLTFGSVSLSVNIDSLADHNHYFGFDNTILVKQKHGSNTQLYIGTQNGKLRFHLSGGLPSSYNFVSSLTLQTDVWYHVTVTWNGSQHKIYIDGALDNTYSSNVILNSMTGPSYFSIGACEGVGSYGSFSEIDNLGFWTKELDSTEIFQLYHSTLNISNDSILYEPVSNIFQTIPGTAHFTTSHSDTSATYQWQQNTGTGWTNLSDFGIYSGTTTDSLVLTGITTSLNGYGYRCIIDACTMDTTDIAYLTVVDNVGIDEDEATITIAPNPTSGLLTIGLNSTTEYKVYNVNGQVVSKGNTDGQIDLTNLPSGSYQLILDSEDGSTVHSIQKI